MSAVLWMFSAADQSPEILIKESNQKILKIYRDHGKITAGVAEDIFLIVSSVSDFRYTAEKIVAPYSSSLSEKERGDFVDLMTRYLKLVLKVKLKGRAVIKFDYLGESHSDDQAVVKTCTYYKNRRVNVDYILIRREGGWKIFNYRVDDTDTILSYQKQFTKLFDRYSFDSIVSKIKIKMTKLKLKLGE